MALSRLQKGMIGLGAALVAVIIVGYAGMRYLENAVAENIRAWAAQTPPHARVEVGEVSYTLMESHLAVKDVRFAYKPEGQPGINVSVAQLDVLQPGEKFFALLRDPQTDVQEARLSVAGSIRAQGITIGPVPAVTVNERVISGLQIKTAPLKTFLASPRTGDMAPLLIELAYALSYESDVSRGISSSIPDSSYAFSMKEGRGAGCADGHLRSYVVTGLAVRNADKEVCSIAEMAFENMNLPPQDTFLKLIAPEWQEKTPADEQALEVVRLFGGPKPLLGSLVMRDLRFNNGLETFSLGKMTYLNPSTSPFAADFSVEHLKLPTALSSDLQALSVMGLRDLDASASLSFSLPAPDGAFSVASSLNLVDLGTADALFKGTLPQEILKEAFLIGARSESPEEEERANELVQQNIRFSRLEVGYADEGLLPRVGVLTRKLMGLAPEQAVLMIQQYLGLTPDDPDMERIDAFMAKPGAIRLILSSEKPLSLEEIESLPKGTSDITLEVTPGPKTLQELMSAVEM